MTLGLYKYCSSSDINDNISLIDLKKMLAIFAVQFQNLFNHFKRRR